MSAGYLLHSHAQMPSVSPSHWVRPGLVTASTNCIWRKTAKHCSGLRLVREPAAFSPQRWALICLTTSTLTRCEIHSNHSTLQMRCSGMMGFSTPGSIECILQSNCFHSYFFNCGKRGSIFLQISQDFLCVYASVTSQPRILPFILLIFYWSIRLFYVEKFIPFVLWMNV